MSTTGPEAAESRVGLKIKKNEGSGRIHLGNVNFTASANLRETYNDNISLSENDEKSDLITQVGFGVKATYNLTALNNFGLGFNLAIEKYAFHPDLDTFNEGPTQNFGLLLLPGTGFDFTFYSSGIIFTLFDHPLIEQDPISVPQLSNVTSFRRLTNILGLGMEWDLNKIMLNGEYNYNIFRSFEDQFDFLNQDTHTLSTRATVRTDTRVTPGLAVSYSFTDVEQSVQNNSHGYNIGPFVSVGLTDYLSLFSSVGYQSTTFDRGGSIGDVSDFNSIVYSISVQNQLNRWINHSVTYSKFSTLGIGSNFTEIDRIDYVAKLDILRNISTSLNFTSIMMEDSPSLTSELADQYSLTPELSWSMGQYLKFKMDYHFTLKDSQRVGNSYTQNAVSLNASISY